REMSLKPLFRLQQSQSLAMTPQMLQSIKLLQFNTVELDQFISSEIERNPLLKRDESPPHEAPEPDLRAASDAASISERLGTSLENLFPDDPGSRDTISPDLSAQWRSAGGNGLASPADGEWNPEAFLAAPPSLRDLLQEQIPLIFKQPRDRLIASQLAESLDDAGYLIDFDDIDRKSVV